MKNLKEIKKKSLKIKDETEQKLYCIQENNYIFDENFEKVFKFKFSASIKGKDMAVSLDKEKYLIEKESRLINFIIKKKDNIRYIYNFNYFGKVIESLNIKYYSINNDKLDNSLESEFSNNEIFDLFKQENVKTIFKIETDEKKLNDLFLAKDNITTDKISDLSLNAGFYYPEYKDDKVNVEIFSENNEIIKKFFYKDNKNILYLIGTTGSSKSLFLINICSIFNTMKFPVLYINYKVLKNLDERDRKYIFKKEMIYLFHDFNKFKDFYDSKYHRLIKGEKNNFLHNLKEFIRTLINIYENTFDAKILLIIDNFDEDDEILFSEMEELINLINQNSKKINSIISGKSNFLIKKFILFLKRKNFSDIIEKQALFLYYIKLKTNNEIKSLVSFNYRKIINEEELENTLFKEETEYCKKLNISGLYFSLIKYGKNIELEKLLEYIYLIPFEYLKFSINEDRTFKFEYFNPIFFNAVQKSIKSEIKENSLKFLLTNDNKDYLINGIYEEKLLTTLISYNKLKLENMKTTENNLLEVDKICEFKYKFYKKISKKLENNLFIIINQKNYRGELYDLLVLIPKKDNKGDIIFTAYMIQIGTNKTGSQINEIKNDFDDNKKNYLLGINTFIDNKIKIKNIELLFIFDMETQNKHLLNNTKKSKFGAKYCCENGIKYYCFSYDDDYELYKSFDYTDYFKIKEFGDFSEYNIKKNWSKYLSEIFKFLNEEEKDFINSKITDGSIKDYGVFIKEETKFKNIKIVKKYIYVFKSDKNKFFIINGIIYKHIVDQFEMVNEEDIESKEIFKLYVLNRLNIDEELKMKSE